jgi:hypothetical protein
MEGRSYSPRPRKLDERHHREEWDRRREESPRDREPPGLRRTVPLRPGRPRSSSREKAYTDSQRDVNEGTINVLRSMHAKLMTMQGQTGKNSGYPYFDGTLKEYPKFRRRWHTFQDLYQKATPQRELVNLFRENCLEKKVADRLRCEETMAGCWRVLDPFYSRPTQYAQDLMSEITATRKIQHSSTRSCLSFWLNVLYDWGATASMISEEAVEVMGLAITKQAKRIIKGLGGATTVSKGTCILSLVARNGDRKTVAAWEVSEIASLPGGEPPEDIDEQFPGLRYLSEPNCLIQKAGPIHVLLGMDHAHLMPEHVAESTDLGSQLRLMSSMFGGQHILVGEGAPRLSWVDAMDADERYEAAANGRKKQEDYRKLAQEARQTALKHTHNLPKRL